MPPALWATGGLEESVNPHPNFPPIPSQPYLCLASPRHLRLLSLAIVSRSLSNLTTPPERFRLRVVSMYCPRYLDPKATLKLTEGGSLVLQRMRRTGIVVLLALDLHLRRLRTNLSVEKLLLLSMFMTLPKSLSNSWVSRVAAPSAR